MEESDNEIEYDVADVNVNNHQRIETYLIRGKSGWNVRCLNRPDTPKRCS